jgi:hypothetical protein
MTKGISGQQHIAAEPLCIRCRNPLGAPKPIGKVIGPDGSKILYDTVAVGTLTESFIQCLSCMEKDRLEMVKDFIKTLNSEQARMYNNLQMMEILIYSYRVVQHS